MDVPQNNPQGYEKTSVIEAAKNLHGRLLIVHGAIDDNVHLENTFKLVYALQQADKEFELMIYPQSRHGIGGMHYNRLVLNFIKTVLQLDN
jgi:dipeptidyl aminopeptidase/acylaminoacyl peptidase